MDKFERNAINVRLAFLAAALLIGCALTSPAAAAQGGDATHGTAPAATTAPLFEDRGDFHMPISTSSPQAQRYFDQGMRLMFGFNLEEAQRSFEQAEKLDTTCAMCSWGTAFSLGPHINLAALPERTVAADAAVKRAQSRLGGASPMERALVAAMTHRYTTPAPTTPAAQAVLDSSYAAAMHAVMLQYPDDANVAALWAEAAMDMHPWDLYLPDRTPQPWTGEIVAALEKALGLQPDHVGANHLYIHAVEASSKPERALDAARRIAALEPGEGHLVHMPSHIYHRVGLFDLSNDANRRAVIADDRYRKAVNPQGFYLMYSVHNHQFLMWSCWMAGRYEESLRESRAIFDLIPLDMLRQMPGFDFAIAYPAWTMIRFGRWQDVLAEPAPPQDFAFARGAWHAARAIANAQLKHLDAATADRDSAAALNALLPADALEGLNNARTLLTIATNFATGVIVAQRGDTQFAVDIMTRAANAEDQLRYDEPSDNYLPVRHALGAILLTAGRAKEAQAVYERDLDRNPGNGWALTGLAKSLKAQRKGKDANIAEARALKALKDADVKVTGSWF